MTTSTFRPEPTTPDDLLALHLQREPAFRALIRTLEHRLFQEETILRPVLDIGVGDGHFAAMVFPAGLDAGIDVTWPIVAEGKVRGPYRLAAVADGTRQPYRTGSFETVVSNCVIEHIPDAEALVAEAGRVLAPGGRFIFSVINDNFPQALATVRGLRRIGLRGPAQRYSDWWNRHAVHFHFDDVATWRDRLARHGLQCERHAYYLSPAAAGVFEAMHYYAIPSALAHRFLGRWSVRPDRVRTSLAYHWLRPYANEPEPRAGACSFFVARKG